QLPRRDRHRRRGLGAGDGDGFGRGLPDRTPRSSGRRSDDGPRHLPNFECARRRSSVTITAMGNATGFTYDEHSDGSVTVFHHGRKATVLRGTRAQEFLAELEHGDRQTVMARWT